MRTHSAWLRTVALAAASLSLFAACAHTGARAPSSAPAAGAEIGWPPPPDRARVRFVQTFAVPRDLGIRKNWFRRVVTFVAGTAPFEEMLRPHGVAAGVDGLVAVADPDGPVVHLYDTREGRYARVTHAGKAPLAAPVGAAIDTAGTVYVSDAVLRCVFRFDRAGKWLGTLGGAAEFERPTGLAWDAARGLLFVVDTTGHRVRAYDAAGTRVLSFGSRGRGDGEFNYPVALALGPGGEVYVDDSMNHRVQVFGPDGAFRRRFGAAGSGPGAFDKSKGIGVDGDGHVYVADAMHDVVQVFDGEGRLLTIIGGSGDGPGEFSMPTGVFIDATGRILVADAANRRVQVLRYVGDAGDAG